MGRIPIQPHERVPFEEALHNPISPLPKDHVPLLALLLQYCAEVLQELYNGGHGHDWGGPPGTELDHLFTSVFEDAMGNLEEHGLVVSLREGGPFYRFACSLDAFANVLGDRYEAGHLKFDDFNRALRAPLFLDFQTAIRGTKATTASILNGLRGLGLISGSVGQAEWTSKATHYSWFSARGKAIAAAFYEGTCEFERLHQEARD